MLILTITWSLMCSVECLQTKPRRPKGVKVTHQKFYDSVNANIISAAMISSAGAFNKFSSSSSLSSYSSSPRRPSSTSSSHVFLSRSKCDFGCCLAPQHKPRRRPEQHASISLPIDMFAAILPADPSYLPACTKTCITHPGFFFLFFSFASVNQ